MADDPRWPRASAWLASEQLPVDVGGYLRVIGAPVRHGSLSGGRFDLAPHAIREALTRFSTWDGQQDIRSVYARDSDDLSISADAPDLGLETIRGGILDLLLDDAVVAVLGGDNSITRSGVLALARSLARDRTDPLRGVGLLTFDAHHDLRDTSQGLSNGNPVRALLEDGLPGEHVVQVGIQPFANSPEYAEVARDAGITVIDVDEVRRRGIEAVVTGALDQLGALDAIYVDLDVDVLDRAFAPACPGSRPGGLTPAEMQAAARLCGAHPNVLVLDLVEVDPERDVADVTVLATASFLLAFASGLARRSP